MRLSPDPRVKLFCILLLTTMALTFKSPLWMLGLCIVTLLLSVFFGADIIKFFMRFRHFLILLLMISVVQIVFIRQGAPLITIRSFVLVTQEGLFRGLNIAMRYFVILSTASVMSSENNRRVIQGLVQMHIPYILAFMVSIALRFLPQFRESFSDALTSIQLRGIELKEVPIRKRINLYGHLLLPVVAEAVSKSQDLSIAMDARGFGAMGHRTSYLRLYMRLSDWILLFLLAVSFITAYYFYYTSMIGSTL